LRWHGSASTYPYDNDQPDMCGQFHHRCGDSIPLTAISRHIYFRISETSKTYSLRLWCFRLFHHLFDGISHNLLHRLLHRVFHRLFYLLDI